MAQLSLKRYSFLLSIQIILLLNDLVMNCVGGFFSDLKARTFLYFLQDSSLLILIASLVYICYSTHVYQVGLSEIIVKNFGFSVFVMIFYILTTVGFHVASVNYKEGFWIAALNGVQKICKNIELAEP
jgi:hypothetical protein